MKVNISDLLDDFTPGQDLEFLDDSKEKINLKAVKRSVNQRITGSKGGHFMHYSLKYRIIMACIAGIVVLSLGGITVNAATNGALLKSLRIIFINEDGSEDAYNMIGSYIDEEGNTVAEYGTKDGGTFTVTVKNGGSKTSVEADEESSSSISISESISPDGGKTGEEQVIVSIQSALSEAIGIDIEKYADYEPGTYEETNKDGNTYQIVVSENGSIDVHKKE